MKKGETIEPVLISRQMLAERWSLTPQAILNYENEGVITRNPNIPTPRYNLYDIRKIEGAQLDPLSPIERKRLEREVDEWKTKYENLRKVLGNILTESSKIINL